MGRATLSASDKDKIMTEGSSEDDKTPLTPLRVLYLALGFFFFGLGAVGAFLPVLPTTPFLLLASFFFTKGSPRFEKWFTSTKLYKDYLASYLKHRSMTRKRKFYLLGLATVMMVISMVLVPRIEVRIFLLTMIIFMHHYFVRYIKTISPEEEQALILQDKAELLLLEEKLALQEMYASESVPVESPTSSDDLTS